MREEIAVLFEIYEFIIEEIISLTDIIDIN